MTDQGWNDDDVLLTALGEALRYTSEVPRRFVEAGKAAYAWRGIDADLATLTFDSTVDLAVTREQRAPLRALTFASSHLSIHVGVTNGALHGQVVPQQPGEMEIHVADGPFTTVTVDEVGWFAIRPIPGGSFQLRFLASDGTTVQTDWINL